MIFHGQGPVTLGDYDTTTGEISNEVLVSCGKRTLTLNMQQSLEEVKETCSGRRMATLEYATENGLDVELELAEFSADELALALHGDKAEVPAGTVSGEVLPTMVAGGIYHTKRPKISSLVLVDSAGSPASLTENTHYSILSADHGRIKLLDLASFTQPFAADYSYDGYTNLKPMMTAPAPKALVFDGESMADGSKVRVTLARLSFRLVESLALVADQLSPLQLRAKALYAEALEADSLLAPYGRIEVL